MGTFYFKKKKKAQVFQGIRKGNKRKGKERKRKEAQEEKERGEGEGGEKRRNSHVGNYVFYLK